MSATATADALERLFTFEPRPARPSDMGYVIATMTESIKGSYPETPWGTLTDAVRDYLRRELTAGAALTVAPAEPGGDALWGWALTRDGGVGFVYVKRSRRRGRVATRLLAAAGVAKGPMITRFVTRDLRNIATRSSWKVAYVPVL